MSRAFEPTFVVERHPAFVLKRCQALESSGAARAAPPSRLRQLIWPGSGDWTGGVLAPVFAASPRRRIRKGGGEDAAGPRQTFHFGGKHAPRLDRPHPCCFGQ